MKTLSASLLALSFVAACSIVNESQSEEVREIPITSWPLPTENWLGADAEESQKSRRKAWFEERHSAAPGVSWRDIERTNGMAQLDKRNRIARDTAPLNSAITFADKWVERGSENLAGRMHVAVYSTDGSTLYAGSSKGGVWKGSPSGDDWTPIGDNLYGGAHWLAVVSGVNPGDPDIVLAAQDSGLVKVSTDDGASWITPDGLPAFNQVRRVIVTSDGTETVFIVARSGGTTKLYRSLDRMVSFNVARILGTYASDVWTPRTGSADIYTMGNNNVLKSTDLGDSWVSVGQPPAGSSGCELVGSEAGAPRLWGVFTIGGTDELHRSDDAGASWTYIRDLTDYWGSLNASIVDADLFVYGGVEAWRTANGGASFAKVNSWAQYYGNIASKLHADIPGIDVWPVGPAGETWYVATDGGLYESTDQLASVNNLSLQGLRVSQYYSTLTSAADPLHVAAGAQDQGYQWADSPPAATNTRIPFRQLISGDYGHLTSGNGTHAWVFSTYPGFILAARGENGPALYQVSFPSGESNAWLPPVVASELNIRNFFFCATRLWRYKKSDTTHTWTSTLQSTHDFATTNGEYLSAFVISRLDSKRAYAASNKGRLYHSENRGVDWTQSSNGGPTAHYFYGTAILASSSDVDVLWVGGSGYGSPAVYKSTDGGASFEDYGQGLPSTLVYCLAEAPDGSGDIFCGTETAAYMRAAGSPAWIDITGNTAPVTTYWSVEAHPAENTMRFGTYGRGIWDYQIDTQARALVANGSGSNNLCFANVQPPEFGANWVVEVDASLHPGATFTGLIGHELASSGTFVRGNEILLSLASPRLVSVLQPTSGAVDSFSFPVPNDPALEGVTVYAQGFILGGAGYELCNALEVVLGF